MSKFGLPKMKSIASIWLYIKDDCKCGNEAHFECPVMQKDFCSEACREKEFQNQVDDNNRERIAEITSGGQI